MNKMTVSDYFGSGVMTAFTWDKQRVIACVKMANGRYKLVLDSCVRTVRAGAYLYTLRG